LFLRLCEQISEICYRHLLELCAIKCGIENLLLLIC